MNLFQLILKQMRQRALSTVLTTLSITLGVALAISILILQREGQSLFGQNDYGFEVLAGVKASGLQLVVNSVYHIDRSPGNIKYSVYEDLFDRKLPFRADVKTAIPQSVGDTYQGQPIVATTAEFFGYDDAGKRVENDPDAFTPRRFEYRPHESFEIADGKPLDDRKFEAVIGSDCPKLTGLKVGDQFQATHGVPQPGQPPEVHKEKWTVVGVLRPTHTAADHCVWIGLTSFYTIATHAKAELQREMIRQGKNPAALMQGEDEEAVQHYHLDDAGNILLDPDVLKAREISYILIKARGGFNAQNVMYNLNLQPDVMAVSPAVVMRDFFANFIKGPSLLLLVIAALVIVVAATGVLTAIYNSVAARGHEIAVLRALGATRGRILVLITAEATLLGIIGAAIGFVLGHALAGVGSAFMAATFGQGIHWLTVSGPETACLGGVVVLAALAGLVPALKAYRTPVATNLVGV